MKLSAYSPDLKPIENLCAIAKQQFQKPIISKTNNFKNQ